ncbi:MAG: ArdC-like ssDNA-binding domain-containing protein, partial [Candidatus Thermoplasmatota archaeon]
MSGDTSLFSDNEERYSEMKAEVESSIEELLELTEEAKRSEKFKEWLDVQSKFHNYSYRNSWLIKLQCPEASKVAGYRQWQEKFDRHVKEGESAIWIWAPLQGKICPECGTAEYKHDSTDCEHFEEEDVDEDDWDRGIVGFKPVPVFDVSQTEGEELPELDTSAQGEINGLLKKVKKLAEEKGIDVEIVDESEWERKSDGFARDGKVTVKEQDKVATTSVLIHELSHVQAGHTSDAGFSSKHDRKKEELEAESIAYIVGEKFGL